MPRIMHVGVMAHHGARKVICHPSSADRTLIAAMRDVALIAQHLGHQFVIAMTEVSQAFRSVGRLRKSYPRSRNDNYVESVCNIAAKPLWMRKRLDHIDEG
jgi:hypothetical protein